MIVSGVSILSTDARCVYDAAGYYWTQTEKAGHTKQIYRPIRAVSRRLTEEVGEDRTRVCFLVFMRLINEFATSTWVRMEFLYSFATFRTLLGSSTSSSVSSA